MVDVHTGMNISEAEFNLLAEMVLDAMDAEGIPHPVQNDLVARLVPLRPEIIYLP
jgi:hemoglobin